MTDRQYSRPPGRISFFMPLMEVLGPVDIENIDFAYRVAKDAHRNTPKRRGKIRFFDHPKATTWIYMCELGGRDPRAIIDCLLHDVVEDSFLFSPFRLKLNFGQSIMLDVVALTKLPKGEETTEQYLGRIILRGPWAILAKLCDRLHNLRTMEHHTSAERDKQINETLNFHCRLLIPALQLYEGIWREYASMLAEKIWSAIEEARSLPVLV